MFLLCIVIIMTFMHGDCIKSAIVFQNRVVTTKRKIKLQELRLIIFQLMVHKKIVIMYV